MAAIRINSVDKYFIEYSVDNVYVQNVCEPLYLATKLPLLMSFETIISLSYQRLKEKKI